MKTEIHNLNMIEIIEISNNSLVKVFGVQFNGVNSIIEFAKSNKANNGVYVGCDRERYPCFDAEDYASENRYYWNFVFAKSTEELKRKLDMLKKINGRCDYRKLNKEISKDLCPMIYFGGDTYHPMEITVCDEISIGGDATEDKENESFFRRLFHKLHV